MSLRLADGPVGVGNGACGLLSPALPEATAAAFAAVEASAAGGVCCCGSLRRSGVCVRRSGSALTIIRVGVPLSTDAGIKNDS